VDVRVVSSDVVRGDLDLICFVCASVRTTATE
jgi:hypothetical protein